MNRATPLRPCGKRYATLAQAEAAASLKPGAEVRECLNRECGGFHVRSAPVPARVPAARPRRAAGFPAAVKLLVRKRAGDGEAEAASCEACGRFLGRYGGQVQHLVARGMGGTSNPVLATAANGALLCGLTPQDPDGCHFLAESRHREMRERGFWLKQGTDPRAVPMTLHTGAIVWRSEDGRYLDEAPRLAGAA